MIQGLAASDGQVGTLMAAMSRSALFTEVALSYSRPVEAEAHVAREFELACRLPEFE